MHGPEDARNCERKKHVPTYLEAVAMARRMKTKHSASFDVYLCPWCRAGWLLGTSDTFYGRLARHLKAADRARRDRKVDVALRKIAREGA